MQLGVNLSLTRAGVPIWTPRRLFAAGEQGAWYDPSDFSTLYQDSAGTTPVTAVGQPVGLLKDKSGRNNHASQSTTTARPTLQQDSGGRYYLQGDGVDDSLLAANYTPATAQTVMQALAYSSLNASQNSYGQAGDAGGLGLGLTSSGRYYLRYGTGSGLAALFPLSNMAAVNTPVVFSGWSDGSNLGTAINGDADSTLVAANPSGRSGLTLFAFAGGALERMSGRLYGHITIARKLGGAEMSQVKRFLAARSGVTL